jgi:hypothetical protein
MQHMWYEVRCGDAHLAAGALGKALKQYVAVAKHFADFSEDQFDFHSYCVRKMTLRSYLGLLRLEDRLQHHPFYMRVSLFVIFLLWHVTWFNEIKGVISGLFNLGWACCGWRTGCSTTPSTCG